MMALLGINALRRGEQDNCIGCVGPSSCIFPIAAEAVHTRPSGSREAVRWFSAYLDEWPGDLRIRWLLNIAAMTLGDYPEKVPARFRIPVEPFRSKRDLGRFENVATKVGLIARGPDLAGGCIFDDFTGDGRPDIFTTSFDVVHGAALYVNRGDGRFEDRSEVGRAGRSGLCPERHPGRLRQRRPARRPAAPRRLGEAGPDVAVAEQGGRGLRGRDGRQRAGRADLHRVGRLGRLRQRRPARPVRLRRVSAPARPGLGRDSRRPSPTLGTTAGSITTEGTGRSSTSPPRPASRTIDGRRDRPGATTTTTAGSTCSSRTWKAPRGSIATSATARSSTSPPSWTIVGPPHGFTCMFWDYDNDGRLDILVGDYSSNLGEVVADYLGLPVHSEDHAHLYHNLGPDGFREVSREAGLARPMPVMSVNAGDIDNDGDLDLHLGTGWMSLSGLVPDLMYANVDGRFEDVTDSTGTGHLQKGHGVSFADWDDDGDLDLFVVLGGGYPGDRGYNALFQNPGHGHHWLKVKLVGTKTNRSAIGAKLQVDLTGPGGSSLDPPRDRQQRELRRQYPRRVDRPPRCEVRRPPDRHLAHQQDDPDLPEHRRRPGDRDHRRDDRTRSSRGHPSRPEVMMSHSEMRPMRVRRSHDNRSLSDRGGRIIAGLACDDVRAVLAGVSLADVPRVVFG